MHKTDLQKAAIKIRSFWLQQLVHIFELHLSWIPSSAQLCISLTSIKLQCYVLLICNTQMLHQNQWLWVTSQLYYCYVFLFEHKVIKIKILQTRIFLSICSFSLKTVLMCSEMQTIKINHLLTKWKIWFTFHTYCMYSAFGSEEFFVSYRLGLLDLTKKKQSVLISFLNNTFFFTLNCCFNSTGIPFLRLSHC